MDALAQIAAMADSFEEAEWAARRAGDTSSAGAYLAARNLINATFNREVTP